MRWTHEQIRAQAKRGGVNREQVEQLLSEVERLAERVRAAMEGIAVRNCLCEGHLFNPPHGGPCCGVAGGLCVTCSAREALDQEGQP